MMFPGVIASRTRRADVRDDDLTITYFFVFLSVSVDEGRIVVGHYDELQWDGELTPRHPWLAYAAFKSSSASRVEYAFGLWCSKTTLSIT